MDKKLFSLFWAILIAFTATAKMPWQNVAQGNAYWAQLLGMQPQQPIQKSVGYINSLSEVNPDPAFQLVNAALRYQIDHNLHSNELKRFADSTMHIVLYVSGANPKAKNNCDRSGWWNLSYPVALRYGLQINALEDERFDFEKSTAVALKYAKDLQKKYGKNWVYAFVDGPLLVARYPKFKEDTLHQELDAMYKLMVISNYTSAEEYAVNYFYKNVESWKSNEVILADLIIEKTGISKDVFFALNPSLTTDEIPSKTNIKLTSLALQSLKKNREDIALLSQARLADSDEKLIAKREKIEESIPNPSNTKSVVYRVKSGDNLGFIAEKYGVGVSQIKSWNNLKGDVIFAGQKLMIYSKEDQKTVSSAIAKAESNKEASKDDFLFYRVKSGDTLWSIAKQFPGVSPDNLMTWNGITPSISVGQKIKVKKSVIRDYNSANYPDSF